MPIVESELAALQIPTLAALATGPCPAWLWSTDASRILWANAVGAEIFGAADAAEIGKSAFAPSAPAAVEIARLAATLPSAGQERLERLRGFGARFGRALVCACSRIVMPDGTGGILVAATEPAGPSLSLRERVRRLFPDGTAALAAFTPDGSLLHANAAALQCLGGSTTLSALGLQALGAEALTSGRASGTARLNQANVEVTATGFGRDESRVLVVALPARPDATVAGESAGQERQESEPAQAQSAPEPSMPVPPPAAIAEAKPSRHSGSEHGPTAERRHPLRFVWQMDGDGRFAVGSDEFVELVGPRTIAACGRLWSEIAAELKLDPDNQVARAIATRETWSGISISWPVDDTSERLPVELSGLPVFDRDRAFAGYRGFGVCRDVARVNELAQSRRARPIGFMPPPQAREADGGGAAPAQNALAATAPNSLQPAPAEADASGGESTLPIERAAAAPAAANVVPFRASPALEAKPPSLSAVERNAFSELAQELTARLRGAPEEPAVAGEEPHVAAEATPAAEIAQAALPIAAEIAAVAAEPAAMAQSAASPNPPPVADHVLLDRVPAGVLVYRNDALLYANRQILEWSGYERAEALAAAGGLDALFGEPGTGALSDSGDAQTLSIMTQRGDRLPVEARLLTIPWNGTSALALILTSGQAEQQQRATQLALDAAQNEIRDLKSNVERSVHREAQKAAATKAEFIAKVSHEIRTPLNSMIGFAEVIMAERFGPIGNERYREYLKDMHAAGTHLVSLLNDLLDLSKIETGQLDLNFVDVDLNDLTQQCVAIMQPQANRARIIIRTAMTPGLPHVKADARSLRQIVLNLLSNAIKLTGPGGQVIVSTATADGGEALLRVRDTGVGMRETDIEAMLDPLHPIATSAGWGSGGSGLGLPLTKALAEANRAKFSIKSAPNAGTLVEIAFPSNRMTTR
jgi:signal transduction histidine kinase